jgi:fructose-1,6-bisphosphatase
MRVNHNEIFKYYQLGIYPAPSKLYVFGDIHGDFNAFTLVLKNANLIDNDLLDKFETRYVIFDTTKININELEKLIYYANVFEVEWLKYVSSKYILYANKDSSRIKMIEERLSNNTCQI